jgi:predicted kinase
MKTFQDFLEESAWARIAARAYKSGRSFLKTGIKSGTKAPPLDIKMVGMPGSGKSTMAKKLAQRTGGTSTGYDDARQTIHGNRSNQGKFPEVHALTMKRLKDAPQNKPRIQDNTNVNSKFKKSTDDALKKEAGFRNVTNVATDTSQKRSFSRNANREQPVPNFVMRSMASQERRFRNTKEGQKAIELGRELSKDYLLNRRSTRARLGVQNPKRGKFQEKTLREFQEFVYESGLARLALRGVKAASKAGKVARTADGGRRVTSAARAARNAKPAATMSRAERGEDAYSLAAKRETAAKINPQSIFFDPSARSLYRRQSYRDRSNTIISGAAPRDRNITTARAAAQKAGFKGGGAKNRFDYTDPGKYHTTYPQDKYADRDFKHPKTNTQVDTEINTIASGRKAAAISSGTKRPVPVSRPGSILNSTQRRVPSTDEITRKMKEYRRRVVQTGGQERNPVHTVDFIPRRDDYGVKGELDKSSRKVGRNFVQRQIDLPKELEKAGARQGDIISGNPSHMRKGEDPKLGREVRARMYQRRFGKRVKGLDPSGRVRYMIGAVGGDVKK